MKQPNEEKIDELYDDALSHAEWGEQKSALTRLRKGPHRYGHAIELAYYRKQRGNKKLRNGYWDRVGRLGGITVRLGIPFGTEKEGEASLQAMIDSANELGIKLVRSYSKQGFNFHGGIYNCYVIVPRYEPDIEDDVETDEVDESTKVTLTVGQLKRLIKES